eukprot:gene332-1710_t
MAAVMKVAAGMILQQEQAGSGSAVDYLQQEQQLNRVRASLAGPDVFASCEALDRFVVETHMLPLSANDIPDDLPAALEADWAKDMMQPEEARPASAYIQKNLAPMAHLHPTGADPHPDDHVDLASLDRLLQGQPKPVGKSSFRPGGMKTLSPIEGYRLDLDGEEEDGLYRPISNVHGKPSQIPSAPVPGGQRGLGPPSARKKWGPPSPIGALAPLAASRGPHASLHGQDNTQYNVAPLMAQPHKGGAGILGEGSTTPKKKYNSFFEELNELFPPSPRSPYSKGGTLTPRGAGTPPRSPKGGLPSNRQLNAPSNLASPKEGPGPMGGSTAHSHMGLEGSVSGGGGGGLRPQSVPTSEEEAQEGGRQEGARPKSVPPSTGSRPASSSFGVDCVSGVGSIGGGKSRHRLGPMSSSPSGTDRPGRSASSRDSTHSTPVRDPTPQRSPGLSPGEGRGPRRRDSSVLAVEPLAPSATVSLANLLGNVKRHLQQKLTRRPSAPSPVPLTSPALYVPAKR